MTTPLSDTPIVRYPDHAVYTRRHGRRYGLGSYPHTSLPLTPTSALASAECPFREADFGPAIAEATSLVPSSGKRPRLLATIGRAAFTATRRRGLHEGFSVTKAAPSPHAVRERGRSVRWAARVVSPGRAARVRCPVDPFRLTVASDG